MLAQKMIQTETKWERAENRFKIYVNFTPTIEFLSKNVDRYTHCCMNSFKLKLNLLLSTNFSYSLKLSSSSGMLYIPTSISYGPLILQTGSGQVLNIFK